MPLIKQVTFEFQGMVKAIHAIYTNHRNETKLRHLQPLSLHFGSDDFHKEEQWFLSCFDMERRNQNETEGARSYPVSKMVPVDKTKEGWEAKELLVKYNIDNQMPPIYAQEYTQQPSFTDNDDQTDWDEPKIFVTVVQMKKGQKIQSQKQIELNSFRYGIGNARPAVIGEIDNALADVRQAVSLLIQKVTREKFW